jgi:uncharacterized caspase-like protein
VLERHTDGSVNFSVKLLSGTGPSDTVTRSELKDAVKDLFAGDSETALFYFAGHGFIEATGGYLISSECKSGDDRLSLNDVLILANESTAKNKFIILDSCHSGVAGTSANNITLATKTNGRDEFLRIPTTASCKCRC